MTGRKISMLCLCETKRKDAIDWNTDTIIWSGVNECMQKVNVGVIMNGRTDSRILKRIIIESYIPVNCNNGRIRYESGEKLCNIVNKCIQRKKITLLGKMDEQVRARHLNIEELTGLWTKRISEGCIHYWQWQV